ncbi:growth-regulated protein homolog gamma-like [Parambassis ranga]|uniref:Growth-regulated protein homolog gamma-like n=1 Tax=Parambassis ranga TaxID=210632 RepID=A0A6P7J6X9_9TELE|nr:growth-regulated protein homolog gamma-like [Parambassis ranga]
MSSFTKMFLLLAAVVCVSQAQYSKSSQCLCKHVRNAITSKSQVKDIQIYQATVFCNQVEIVVTMNNGYRYCLNPKLSAVKRLLSNVMNKQKPTTGRSLTPTPSGSTTPFTTVNE